jgi:hypothetical protein
MPTRNLLAMLEGGDRRMIGRSEEAVVAVLKNPKLFGALIRGLWSENVLVRMRAADAVEKATRERRKLLQPYKKELLGLLSEAEEQELRWHLAAIVPRLELNASERQRAAAWLENYLDDRSSIVKTFALQGLADLAIKTASLRGKVLETLREAARSGTPAMKARSRKLLAQLERG